MLRIPCGFYPGQIYHVIKNVYSVIIYLQEDIRTQTSEQNSLPPPTRQCNINKHIINISEVFTVHILNVVTKTIFGTFSDKYSDSTILSLFTGATVPDIAFLFTKFTNLCLILNKSHFIKQQM
jgi:hypothetical protein